MCSDDIVKTFLKLSNIEKLGYFYSMFTTYLTFKLENLPFSPLTSTFVSLRYLFRNLINRKDFLNGFEVGVISLIKCPLFHNTYTRRILIRNLIELLVNNVIPIYREIVEKIDRSSVIRVLSKCSKSYIINKFIHVFEFNELDSEDDFYTLTNVGFLPIGNKFYIHEKILNTLLQF